jgi:Sigma-70 region 2
MLTQSQAERFVRSWTTSSTLDDAAADLERPPSVVNRIAEILRREGVRLKHMPAQPAPPPAPTPEPAPAAPVKRHACPPRSLQLTPEQESRLVEHFPLVDKVVAWMAKSNRFVARLGDDAQQVGRMALARAIQNFRDGRGANFSTYARMVIRDWILREATKLFGPNGRNSGEDDAEGHMAMAVAKEESVVESLMSGEEWGQVCLVVGPLPVVGGERELLLVLAARLGIRTGGSTLSLRQRVANAIRGWQP